MPDSAWSLHSQLTKDTIDIGDLPLCRVLVIKDANYPWLLLVPRREGAVEIIDLSEVEQAQLMTEVSRVARALKEVTKCDKLNIAALGNMVPQLHLHVIARRSSDAAWLPLPHPEVFEAVMPGHHLLIDDGKVRLVVERADTTVIEARVLFGGPVETFTAGSDSRDDTCLIGAQRLAT